MSTSIPTNIIPTQAASQLAGSAPTIPRASGEDVSLARTPLEVTDELSIRSAVSPEEVPSELASPEAAPPEPEATQNELTDDEAVEEEPAEAELTEEEEEQVEELEDRDREVRTHEQAHLAAAGPYALGGPTYEFQKGPDGQNYAVGGEVQIDTAPVEGDPEATIQKARVVRAAALAPAEPSAQDRKVAAQASQTEQQARTELQAQRQQEPSANEESTREEPVGDVEAGTANLSSTGQSETNRTASKLLQLIAQNAVNAQTVNLNLLA